MLRFAFAVVAVIAVVAVGACSLDRSGLGPVEAASDDGGSATGGQGPIPCGPCGPCQICGGDGTCAIDPNSRWEIVCVSAAVAPSPSDADKWDPAATTSAATAPDPFCQFDTGAGAEGGTAATGVTTSIADTFMPSWNQVITPPGQTISAADLLDVHATWLVTVSDDDGCTDDQGCLSQTICTLAPPMNAAWLNDGVINTPAAPSCQELSLRLVCQQ